MYLFHTTDTVEAIFGTSSHCPWKDKRGRYHNILQCQITTIPPSKITLNPFDPAGYLRSLSCNTLWSLCSSLPMAPLVINWNALRFLLFGALHWHASMDMWYHSAKHESVLFQPVRWSRGTVGPTAHAIMTLNYVLHYVLRYVPTPRANHVQSLYGNQGYWHFCSLLVNIALALTMLHNIQQSTCALFTPNLRFGHLTVAYIS